MQERDLSQAVWRKSSRSNGNGGACVEVAVTPEVVGVRDTKDRDGGTLTFTPDRWAAFLTALKNH
ncbi:DUF397 domain-containing protein [Saccharopolyspora thermophila]|uniref:DUF397 domain-containing protein n=1 Tax=Saccharopolyspora thermophila TaxID=89367 RepID=A0ABN1C1W8_9PSEU